MSEPVTNAQIEDVLSSIRRLVSDETNPAARKDRPAAPEPVSRPRGAPAADPADRLVLTPALRVSEAAEEGDEGGGEAAPPAVEADAPAVPAWADPGATLFAATRDAAVDDAPSVPAQTAEAPEDEALPPAEATATETRDDDTSPTPREDGSVAPTAASEADGIDAEPAAPDGAAGEDEPAIDAPEAPLAEDTLTFHSTRAESLSAKIEALEAVIGRTRDQWEPDGTSDDAYAGTPVETLAWRDAEDTGAETADADGGEDLTAEEAVIDEDSLRELVAEIVRQELQGALGERITRNVRKLVRREIHRALAAQDLE